MAKDWNLETTYDTTKEATVALFGMLIWATRLGRRMIRNVPRCFSSRNSQMILEQRLYAIFKDYGEIDKVPISQRDMR